MPSGGFSKNIVYFRSAVLSRTVQPRARPCALCNYLLSLPLHVSPSHPGRLSQPTIAAIGASVRDTEQSISSFLPSFSPGGNSSEWELSHGGLHWIFCIDRHRPQIHVRNHAYSSHSVYTRIHSAVSFFFFFFFLLSVALVSFIRPLAFTLAIFLFV